MHANLICPPDMLAACHTLRSLCILRCFYKAFSAYRIISAIPQMNVGPSISGVRHHGMFLDSMAHALSSTPPHSAHAQHRVGDTLRGQRFAIGQRIKVYSSSKSSAASAAGAAIVSEATAAAVGVAAHERTPLLDVVSETASRTGDVPLHIPGHKVRLSIFFIPNRNCGQLRTCSPVLVTRAFAGGQSS